MSMTVLVTGARGYLGGRIVQHLEGRGDIVLRAGVHRAAPGQDHPAGGRVSEASIDLGSTATLRAACAGVDCVVHLAAVNEIVSAHDPLLALEVNGLGSLRLLQAAIEEGVKRFIYFSTAHVYGAPLSGEIDERRLPRPTHPYAITHRTAEDFVLAAHDGGKLTGLVVRLSNGMGAPARADVDRWSLVVNDLCRQAVVTGRLVLKTAGLQRRDFVSLVDVAAAVEHLIFLAREDCLDGLFNLGGEQSFSILEIAELVASRCQAVLGFNPPLSRPSAGSNEAIMNLSYKIDKLKGTGFALKGSLEKEIDDTLLLCRDAFRNGGNVQ